MAYGSPNGSVIRVLLILGVFSLGLSMFSLNGIDPLVEQIVRIFFFEILGLFLILYALIIWRTQQK